MLLFQSPWELLGALMVFSIGFIIAWFVRVPFGLSVARASVLYVWHTVFCVAYALYVIKYGGDSLNYYISAQRGDLEFSFGTAAVKVITAFFVGVLDFSFIATFLLFNIFGTIGLFAYDASLKTASANKPKWVRLIATVVVFLPSVSFWSAGLGKDAIAFMAAGLALWSAIKLERRVWLMLWAMFFMLVVRPHVAGMMLFAITLAILAQKNIARWKRTLLFFLALFLGIGLLPFVLKYAGLEDSSGVEDLQTYIEQRQGYNMEGGGGVDISSMSPPMQLFTYLFRPLPNEAGGFAAFAASLDNVVLLGVCLLAIVTWVLRRQRGLPGNRVFMFLFAMVAWVTLAITTSNLGISVRQKWMFLPFLLFLAISILGRHSRKQRQRALGAQDVSSAPIFR